MINDDILDKAEIRRAKTCWHKLEGNDRAAVTDMLLLENGCFVTINRFCSHLPCYSAIMRTVTDTFMVAMLGHQYELQLKTKMGIDHFTLESYIYQNLMKGSFHRFYMPAALAMLLAGCEIPN